MIIRKTIMGMLLIFLIPALASAAPSVYPTGVTIYKPQKCWNGFTLLDIRAAPGKEHVPLIDMNGNVVHEWEGLRGYPPRALPGGYLVATSAGAPGAMMEEVDLVQVDWNGNVVWKFEKWEQMKAKSGEMVWRARHHHDWQREGSPAGYYAPGQEPKVKGGKTLILAHTNHTVPEINENILHDDVIYEVSWEGEILWSWRCADHFDEMGFDEAAKKAIRLLLPNRGIGPGGKRLYVDWLHLNAATYLGPNKWYDSGDERFHPDNILWDSRDSNGIYIIDRKTGKIAWRAGPDYTETPALKKLGHIVGPHNAHMIPKGLPGEGNILVFDNGGWAGYGAPTPAAPYGIHNVRRDYSRVIEFNPVTFEPVWEYSGKSLNHFFFARSDVFYSAHISGAQRLPNGNTLITEGTSARSFEVTSELEIVWEYVSPFESRSFGKFYPHRQMYRSYRIPYEWIPQVPRPEEKAVTPPDNTKLRVMQGGLGVIGAGSDPGSKPQASPDGDMEDDEEDEEDGPRMGTPEY